MYASQWLKFIKVSLTTSISSEIQKKNEEPYFNKLTNASIVYSLAKCYFFSMIFKNHTSSESFHGTIHVIFVLLLGLVTLSQSYSFKPTNIGRKICNMILLSLVFQVSGWMTDGTLPRFSSVPSIVYNFITMLSESLLIQQTIGT